MTLMAAPKSKKFQQLKKKKNKVFLYKKIKSFFIFKKNMITEYITIMNQFSILEFFLQAVIFYNF